MTFKAFITQCGILTNPITIGRGCRQDDPIAPYLFLFGAEILSLLIKTNPNIIHLLITLPTPNSFLMDIKKLFFQIWNIKPDKIKQNSICMNYLDGKLIFKIF